MCGFAGLVTKSGEITEALCERVGASLAHRGPDDQGIWVDQNAGIALVHRRLSIVDLSPAGMQPMHSADGRWVIAFNGEIYNHQSLRAALEKSAAARWRGHSDTEVLLEAIAFWGLETALRRCSGMFALALWDRQTRTLTLARDRMGEKPLYVGRVGGDIVFGSELRALRQHPAWQHAIEPAALEWMLQVGYVPAPWSIHPGVFKLPAGCMLQLKDCMYWPGNVGEFQQQLQRYWNLGHEIDQARSQPWTGSHEQALTEIQRLLDDSVRQQMLADVPVGALLSGGIDSSLIAASMARQAGRKIRTFTVGFDIPDLDESTAASEIAAFLGTDHVNLPLSSSRALEIAHVLPEIYDEPFADAAQIPALMLAQAAKEFIGVALTGDAGDELFHGYTRYFSAARLWPKVSWLPGQARERICRSVGKFAALLPPTGFGRSLIRQAGRLKVGSAQAYAANLIRFPGAGSLPAESMLADPAWPVLPQSLESAPLEEQMRFYDQAFALPEGIHTKLDRASMRAGLELRVPLLDSRLVTLSWQFPLQWQTRGSMGKCLLRELAAKQLPPQASTRRKHGFDVPVSQWLRGPLRKWADNLLAPEALARTPWLDTGRIRVLFDMHQAGKADYGYALWSLLMFRLWNLHYEKQ